MPKKRRFFSEKSVIQKTDRIGGLNMPFNLLNNTNWKTFWRYLAFLLLCMNNSNKRKKRITILYYIRASLMTSRNKITENNVSESQYEQSHLGSLINSPRWDYPNWRPWDYPYCRSLNRPYCKPWAYPYCRPWNYPYCRPWDYP